MVTGTIPSSEGSGVLSQGYEVEMLNSDGTPWPWWCKIPDLPHYEEWSHHSQSGLVTCGGLSHRNSCYTLDFEHRSWKLTHQLLHERYDHSSWLSEKHGVILMGGTDDNMDMDSIISTETLNDYGGSEESFALKYPTRFACSIQFDERVVVTGGEFTKTRVSVYDIGGWIEDLPDLNKGRFGHGCGHYVDDNNKTVLRVQSL